MALRTELIPPSDEDSEDLDIFQSLLHNNTNLTEVPTSEYHNIANDTQNVVYTNLASFQQQEINSREYFFNILSSYISFTFPKS